MSGRPSQAPVSAVAGEAGVFDQRLPLPIRLRCQRTAMVMALTAATIGAVGLLGWILDIPAFKRIHPSWVTMKANTAVCLMLQGLATAAVARFPTPGGVVRALAAAAATVVALVAAATMAEHAFGIDLGIDQFLFVESEAEAGRSFQGRMGPASSLIFMALGTGLLSIDRPTRSGLAPSTAFMLAAGCATLLIFLSYFLQVELKPALLKYVSIALHTVVAFVLLSLAGLLARPDRGFMAIVLGRGAGGEMVRRLLPAVLLIPAVSGWVFVLGRNLGLYGKGGAVALLAALVTVVFTWLILSTAKAMNVLSQGRRVAEGKMEASERLLTDFFSNAAVAMAFVDLDGRWLRVNDMVCQITGYEREELLGHSFVEITHPDDVEPDWAQARQLLDGLISTYTMEKRYLRRDGSFVWVNLSVSLQRHEAGRPSHFITVFQDITAEKQSADAVRAAMEEATASRQRAEAASRAKDDFLAALSHELRTPLTPVLITASDLESDPELSPAVRQQLRMICRNVTLEARLIDDLLDLTRISRGKLELRLATVDVHAAIRDAADIVRADLENRALEFSMLCEAVESHVEADPTRLQQVIWNLLKNAVKFTPDGGKIVVRTSNPRAGVVRIEVRDTGCGIPADAMERIFLPFDQGRLSGQHRFGGLGLGLSISRALMEMHGSTLSVRSDGEGCGSTFSTELPVVAPVVGGDAVAERPAGPVTRPVRLLLVDDHQATLDAMVRLLGRRGFQISQARGVDEALKVAAEERPDVLVSDLGLPDGTGFDLMRAIRLKGDIRGIALSGFGTENDLRQSREAGFSAHLIKPIIIADLLATIMRVAREPAPPNGKAEVVSEAR